MRSDEITQMLNRLPEEDKINKEGVKNWLTSITNFLNL